MFYDQFVKLCKEKGVSPAAVARDIGLSNSSTTTWKRGSIPKGDTLQKLAEYFGVSTDFLLGLQDYGDGFHAEPGLKQSTVDGVKARISEIKAEADLERTILDSIKSLTDRDKQLLVAIMKQMIATGQDSAASMTSAGPYYLYHHPDVAEQPPAPPTTIPGATDGTDTTPGEKPAEGPPEGE